MKGLASLLTFLSLLVFAGIFPAHADEVNIPNTFTAGTPAVAAEVNANFTAVKTAVDDNDSRVAALESALATMQTAIQAQAATISALQSELDAVQASQVMALDAYLTVDETTDPRGPLVQLSGVNLQINNGMGNTHMVNGLGNLIVGYDEVYTGSNYMQCSIGIYGDQTSCETSGGTWGNSFKSGSHNLVLGSENSYTRFSGLLAGNRNFSTAIRASVIGGTGNSARNSGSVITAGVDNIATGIYSSVSGGRDNIASSEGSSVSGGWTNTANGVYSSVSGGLNNWATGNYATVSSGNRNRALGIYSSISGGRENIADGDGSSISGGRTNTANGAYSSISGGQIGSVTGIYDWLAGDLFEDE